jgi:class 3 adenylate cyclase/tetratricopeptide (TPR) repeat protein
MHRKVVTVLFCDVVGSTSLGESVDPEMLQATLGRYFDQMKSIIERYGGSVEKFIGDAVMAVFGVPAVHEDDALRATRAAMDMLGAFPELGIEGRIGVNTGEVVTGTEERLATGDAVNVAARLQQAAAPNEVLIGHATLELVRGAAEVEEVDALELKGKSEPVPAFRLLSVQDAPERRHDSRFVGRERELALVGAAWERARSEQRCELLTIVGDAGVGKSRLIAEALASVAARIVRARCLPYGEGITYWPVVEVLKQLDALPSDPAALAAIRSLLGESERATSAEEIAWSVRKTLEQEAPLVVVLDDIQWGQETFLDLVEGVAMLSSGAPLLILCMARPELLDRRPQWPQTHRLEPLADDEVEELIGKQLPAGLSERIVRAAGGNPLFLTEMLAIAGDSQEVEVPPTLRALLSARLDQLEGSERRILELGAVEGEIFHRGAVQALAPDELQVTPRLAALVRKELIRPDRTQIPGEDAFRFRHLLIRDAAYDALAKADRAELHERFADWLGDRGSELVELDEIVGYHLERAARYEHELGRPRATLAEHAAERLAAAGRRAQWRGDEAAAAGLLERALVLARPHRLDVHLELDLAGAFERSDVGRAARVAEVAAVQARAAADEVGEAAARVVAATYGHRTGGDTLEQLEAIARAAVPLLERAADDMGLYHAWNALGRVASNRQRYEEAQRAAELARDHARNAGRSALAGAAVAGLPGALMRGPVPADQALSTLDAYMREVPSPRAGLFRAQLLAMLGRFDEAWVVAHETSAQLVERNGADWDSSEWAFAGIAALVGDHAASAGHLHRFCDFLAERNLRSYLSTSAPRLARELCAIGRIDDAEPLARLGRELGDKQDIATQMLWRQAQALIHAHRGEHEDAERLARAAVAIGKQTDALTVQGDTFRDLAEVLRASGGIEAAAGALEQALDRYERKKNFATSAQVRARLTELEAVAP